MSGVTERTGMRDAQEIIWTLGGERAAFKLRDKIVVRALEVDGAVPVPTDDL